MVITTADMEACLAFYETLGFSAKRSDGRYQLFAGDFKINVHMLGKELSPHAQHVKPGSADLCFEIDGSIEEYKRELESKCLQIFLGVVERNGTKGAMNSIYLRDPDGNLVEFCSYPKFTKIPVEAEETI